MAPGDNLRGGIELAIHAVHQAAGGGYTVAMTHSNRDWPVGFKGAVGIAACAFGLGVLYFGYGIGTESPKKDAGAEVRTAAPQADKKPVRSMNFALGNMVFFARDLGFAVESAREESVDSSKIGARIESQLSGIRQLYRQEISKTPALAGTLVLQFNIAPSGEVQQLREVASRLGDAEFRKAVAAEASQWSFRDTVTEQLQVTCPLLFVHEGMDITTIVQWEKALAELSAHSTVARATGNGTPNQPAKTAHSAAPTKTAAASGYAPAKAEAGEFRIKYATALRKDPNFSAASLATFTTGTKVLVLSRQGDWMQVRSALGGPTGFVRKEFVAPVEVARN